MAEQSRRIKGSADKLAEYKHIREGGSRKWKPEDDYKSIVKGRLQKDDFVVDDGVSGYMDNGMDDWTGQDDADKEDEEEDLWSRKSAKKKVTRASAKAKVKPKTPQSAAKPSISVYRPAVSAEQEEDFMANLLGGIDAAPIPAPAWSKKRKPSPVLDYDDLMPDHSSSLVPYRKDSIYSAYSSDGGVDDKPVSNPPSSDFEDYTSMMSPKKCLEVQSGSEDAFNTSMDFLDIDMNDFMNIDDMDVKPSVPIKKELPAVKLDSRPIPNDANTPKKDDLTTPSWLSVYDSLAVVSEDTLGSKPAFSETSINALKDVGNLHMFWLDYLKHGGKVYLIGKVKDKTSNTWVSACISIQGFQHNLFILPRPLHVVQDEMEDGQVEMVETDVVPEKGDVYNDFERIHREIGIKSWKARWWMKVFYSYEELQIPMDACLPNIYKIFDTNTSIFKSFVLKQKIMGPCWLVIKSPDISWCKFEASVSDPKDVIPMGDGAPEQPPLTIMSLAVRTVVNHRENKHEVVCVSGRIWRDIQLDDPTPPEQLPCSVHTFVCPLDRFPSNFEMRAKANGRGMISPMQNEHMLLNSLLVMLFKADPDVLVGHDFLGVSLDVLVERMKDVHVEHWSHLGRFRRSRWILIGRQGTKINDGARSMISSTTWSLNIDPDDTVAYFHGSVSFPDMRMTFVRHCELDAHYQMAIAFKVQILPLTRQLTDLAGNAWNKTLNDGHAECNEYILLHEFHKLEYICPDKTFGKKAPKIMPEVDKADDKHKGGLVFESKHGLWDEFILVMDFNSLYPSIIQEYNINFTTVERMPEEEGEDKIPEPPGSEVLQGVLPRLIAALVQRCRQVKSLMKDRSITHAKLLQYDIKQQALKLIANSMYGCLGFKYSRFYARPLASLMTFKGREILTHTCELAESLQLDVVCGDTDSVFVNSNITELADALKISIDFKKAVNDQYELLEIDLDGVFARLLLLQKKEYATIKVEDWSRTFTEVKGLDMKRREYCALSKNIFQYVLDQILSGEATEVIVENIHEYLATIGSNMRSGKVKVDDFTIFKDYPDVTLLKAKGGSACVGDVIPYIFSASNAFRIDYEHYLAHQVLPPIEQLCDPIKGTDRARLAECLGELMYHSAARLSDKSGGAEAGAALTTLNSQVPDAERFRNSEPLLIWCRGCQGRMLFPPIWERESLVLQPSGPTCPAYNHPFREASLQMQLETICDDATCGHQTCSMSMYGRHCVRLGCHGTARFEYLDMELYNQLCYFAMLFNPDKAKKAAIRSAHFD
ncbi:hypothetical protein HD554DRAFT_2052973 [Boletus coccyginus]|nr:hypothetical protein HD554DRAFT_2052973 [Boletus coccyginus]